MPNIFHGINKLSDNELVEEIALLETINMYNISKPIAQKAVKKAVNLINFLGNKVGKDPNIKEPEVKEIWTMLEEKTNELKKYTQRELIEILKDILIEKSKNKEEDLSEDEISVKVIDEASKLYKIPNNLTPAKKADIIYLNYSMKNEESYLDEKNIIEVEYIVSNDRNGKILECLDENEYKKVIENDKISMLNLFKNSDRHMLGKIVWLAVEKYGELFTPKDEDMPSYVSYEEKKTIIKNHKNFKTLKNNLIKLENEIKKQINYIEKIENDLNIENKILKNKIKLLKNCEKDIIDLENSKKSLEHQKKSKYEKIQILEEERNDLNLEELNLLMEEYEKLKLEVFDATNEINNIVHEIKYKYELGNYTVQEIKKKEELIEKLVNGKEKAIKENEKMRQIYLLKKEEIQTIEFNRKSEIFSRWTKTFDKFIIQDDNIKNIVDFNVDELIEIEKCLYELNSTEDPEALSLGLIKEGREKYDYIESTSNQGFTFEVWFKVLEDKKIHIIAINCL